MREVDRVREIVDKHFEIKDMNWTGARVRFVCSLSPAKGSNLDTQFTSLRKILMPIGYIPRVLKSEGEQQDLKQVMEQLATTNLLRGMLEKIKAEDQPEVRDAWVAEFFVKASCPKCVGPLNFTGRGVECQYCEFGKGKAPTAGDYVIEVMKKPKFATKGTEWNLALFFLTILSTVLTGALLYAAREHEDSDTILSALISPYYLARGALFFAFPLMAILGTHEMGHYLMAKRHGIAASLPFFIPLPPGISIFGTMGAFISLREPITDKKALFDIGIAGPIAGMLVAIPVTIIGVWLTSPTSNVPDPGEGPNLAIGLPLLYQWISMAVPHDGGSIHPTAFAGWVGLFITALNLLPAGQLDGGHVARALLGEKAQYLSYATLGAMLILGLFYFQGWLLFAVLIFALGAKHPPPLNDLSELDTKRILVGVLGAVIFIVAITPIPMQPLEYDIGVSMEGDEIQYINGTGEDAFALFVINITNPGQVDNSYDILNDSLAKGWNLTLSTDNVTVNEENDDENTFQQVEIRVFPDNWDDIATSTPVNISIRSQNKTLDNWGGEEVPQKTFRLEVRLSNVHIFNVEPVFPVGEVMKQDFDANNTVQNYTLELSNPGNFTEYFKVNWLEVNQPAQDWELSFFTGNSTENSTNPYTPAVVQTLGNGTSLYLNLSLEFKGEVNDTIKLDLSIYVLRDYDPETGDFSSYSRKNLAVVGKYQA